MLAKFHKSQLHTIMDYYYRLARIKTSYASLLAEHVGFRFGGIWEHPIE